MYGQAGTGVSQEVALERSAEEGFRGALGMVCRAVGIGRTLKQKDGRGRFFCFRRTPLVALYRERDWWLRARVGC